MLLGWQGGQIAFVVGGLVAGLGALRLLGGVLGAVLALGAVTVSLVVAWLPVGGRTLGQWLGPLARWGSNLVWSALGSPRAALGGGIAVVGAPAGGGRPGVGDEALRAVAAQGGHLDGPRRGREVQVGVVHDAGARTLTAALVVAAPGFALLGAQEKQRRVGAWSSALAAVAREGSVVHRLQWAAVATPDDGRSLWSDFGERAVVEGGASARRSYAELLGEVTSSLLRHRTLVCVQIRLGGRAARQVVAAGGGLQGGCAVVARETWRLRQALSDAGLEVQGLLGPRQLAGLFHDLWSQRPSAADALWPDAVRPRWRTLEAGGAWHASYWVAQWPRIDVGPEFLAPLLVAGVRRTLSVTFEPLDPSRALRLAQRARTADVADAELRRRGGFLGSATRSRQSELAVRREAELADGHGAFRFSGYVTVSARSCDALEEACEVTEQAAAQSGLELARLYGQQDLGVLCALPLCAGVR